MIMTNKLVTFVFTVVCHDDLKPCGMTTSAPKLDNFKYVKKGIVEALGDENREKDEHLLCLKGLDIYVGVPQNDQYPGELTNGTRYGRVFVTGMAVGTNIFTKSIEQFKSDVHDAPNQDARHAAIKNAHADMKYWQVRFNYLLHEIFSCDKDKHGNPLTDKDGNPLPPYVENYVPLGRDPTDYHPRNFNADADPPQLIFEHNSQIERPWMAAWTIFVVPNETIFDPMGGHEC